jgi:hypothetical protein
MHGEEPFVFLRTFAGLHQSYPIPDNARVGVHPPSLLPPNVPVQRPDDV